jgi:hypothetical protein
VGCLERAQVCETVRSLSWTLKFVGATGVLRGDLATAFTASKRADITLGDQQWGHGGVSRMDVLHAGRGRLRLDVTATEMPNKPESSLRMTGKEKAHSGRSASRKA